jgi:prepilin signal peptidase PulO-like enzyme (type II secretory pathway)
MPEFLVYGIWIGMAAIVGLLIGSFLNVCIYRLPAHLTIVRGHSFCPNCKHDLGPLDLVPVFSYLLLGRRCRYCHEPISSRYMRVELVTGAYFALAAAVWRPGSVVMPAWLVSLTGFDESIALYETALLMLTAVSLAFCGLLVWAMVHWDEKNLPYGVFLFTIFPVAIRLALQPELLLVHAAGLALSLLVVLIVILLKMLPPATRRQQLHFGLGLGLMGLLAGLSAIQPVLLVLLVELLLMAVYRARASRRSRRGQPADSKQASLLWRSMPLQALVLGSVFDFFF